MAQRRAVRRVQQRLHLRPLGEIRLAHLVAEPGQRAELRHQREVVLAIHVVEPAGAADFLQRRRQLVGLHVVRLDLVLLEQLDLREGLERAHRGGERRVEGAVLLGPPLGVGQEIGRDRRLDLLVYLTREVVPAEQADVELHRSDGT